MAQPLRVLCVTPAGAEGRGGIDRLFLYLRRSGLLCAANGIDMRYRAGRGGGPGGLWMAAFPWRALLFGAEVARWRPDVVHINFATGGSLARKLVLAWMAKRCFGRPVVIHFHGQFPAEGLAKRNGAGRMFLALCRLADRVIVLGEVSKARFTGEAEVPEDRIRIVPNGIGDFGQGRILPKRSDQIRILLAGKVGDHKGVPLLIEALAQVAEEGWICHVAGDGEVERCAALSRKAGLGDRIVFTGWTAAEAVHRLMLDADIVVLPSLSENMPLSLIEGACAGAALIATAAGETRAIARDGINGMIVDRDPDAIAGAIATLIADRDRLASMQVASRRLYESQFALTTMAERLGDVYRELGGPRRPDALAS